MDMEPIRDSDLPQWPEEEGALGEEGAAGADEVPPEVHAAVEALLAEPFPRKPYSLVPAGGERTPEYTDYIIHKDVDTEHQCVFVFDSIVDAFAVAEEYKQATGKEAEAIEIDIYSLDEDRFWVKFYRSNGVVAILSLEHYKQHMELTRDY
jgi:hypothetical protein